MPDDIAVGGEIPARVREAIYERDQLICRMCGIWTGSEYFGPEIHHVIFGGDARGMGGGRVHDIDAMLILCRKCHTTAHRHKGLWQPLLLEVITRPGITAYQLYRWSRAARRSL